MSFCARRFCDICGACSYLGPIFFFFGNHTAVFFLAGFLPGRPDFRVSLMMPFVLRIVIAQNLR